MVRNSLTPAAGSWLDRRRSARQSDDSFPCGVRVTDGQLDGETERWQFAQAAIDELVIDGVTSLQHGTVTLRLKASPDDPPSVDSPREGYDVVAVIEQTTGARLQIALNAERADQLRRNSR